MINPACSSFKEWVVNRVLSYMTTKDEQIQKLENGILFIQSQLVNQRSRGHSTPIRSICSKCYYINDVYSIGKCRLCNDKIECRNCEGKETSTYSPTHKSSLKLCF